MSVFTLMLSGPRTMQVIAQLFLAMDAITSRQVFDTLAQMLDFPAILSSIGGGNAGCQCSL
jgi:hypothetical protein